MTKNVSILTIFFLFGCAGLPIGSVDSQGETGPAGPIGPTGPAGSARKPVWGNRWWWAGWMGRLRWALF